MEAYEIAIIAATQQHDRAHADDKRMDVRDDIGARYNAQRVSREVRELAKYSMLKFSFGESFIRCTDNYKHSNVTLHDYLSIADCFVATSVF